MRRLGFALAFGLAAASAAAQTKEPIALRDMGSFHVGGRVVEITGQPIKEVVFTPGGVPAKMDPNGKYQVEQMYVQYFLPQNRKGKVPLLLWHGGGLTGATYETKPDGSQGWLTYFIRKGWDICISDAVERGRAGWTNTFKGDAIALPQGDPWERFRIGPPGSWNDDKGQAHDLSRRPVSDRGLRAIHEAGRAALAHHRRSDRRRLYRARGQNLPVRGAGQPAFGTWSVAMKSMAWDGIWRREWWRGNRWGNKRQI